MPTIQLGYGREIIDFEYDPGRFEVLTTSQHSKRLTDAEIGEAFDHPIQSPPLEELIEAGDEVLIVTSDATRATGSAQIVNLLVRRLIQNGIAPPDITIIFATGIHRPVRDEEKADLLTPFIAQRIRIINHDAYDATNLIQIGVTADGVPIEVNRALKDSAKVILTGGVGYHYFAGFTGGRKSVCPGLASAATIEATHMLALDFERGGRRSGVATGLLRGNAVSEECERVAALINPTFAINTIVDDKGAIERVFTGHWRTAHERACAAYADAHSLTIPEKRDLVIVSCGGLPYDINMIQAHKALDMAAHACSEGGTIILLAECADGLGRSGFLKWFEAEDSGALESRLREKYEVNGQTAWALLTKAERFRVHMITSLDDDAVSKMRMFPARDLSSVLSAIPPDANGYIMPRGAALLPVI
ncbi:MAG TPA: nickel-dependent lactate racemase [Pyrinomonadaceae bacterium]|nr:nickel-dependent lactate racemase [Pyrinomonadaceae bacterium]